MLVFPFIALGAFGLSALVGVRTAAWVAVGLAVFVVAIFSITIAMCLAGSFAYEWFFAAKQRARRMVTRR
jgi:uncharacterized membrane protein YhiD involved in acid resistance